MIVTKTQTTHRKKIKEIVNRKLKDKESIRFNRGISGRVRAAYFGAEQTETIHTICSISVDKKMYETWPIWDGLNFNPG